MTSRRVSEVPRLWQSTSLILFYLVLICIFSFTAFTLTRKSQEANDRYNQIIDHSLLQADIILAVHKHTADIQHSLTEMLFNSSKDDIAGEMEQIGEVEKLLNLEWERLKNAPSIVEMRKQHTRLLDLYRASDRAMRDVIQANSENPLRNDSAVRLYYEKELPAFRDFENLLQSTAMSVANDIRDQQKAAKDEVAVGVVEVNAWLIGCFVTIIIGIVVISRHHTKLVRAQAESAQVRRLNYEQTSRLTIRAQEEERTRISQELHDNVGQMLVVLKMHVEMAEKDAQPQVLLAGIRERLSRAIHEVRTISHSLSNPITSDISLNESLEWQVDSMKKLTPEIKYNLYMDYSDAERYMNPEIKINLYRIFQEVMTNCLRHSEATVIEIRLIYDEETVTLIVHDNGKGFNEKKAANGIGLSNIYNRAQAFEGTVSFQTQPGHGCLVSVQLPYQVSRKRSIEVEE